MFNDCMEMGWFCDGDGCGLGWHDQKIHFPFRSIVPTCGYQKGRTDQAEIIKDFSYLRPILNPLSSYMFHLL